MNRRRLASLSCTMLFLGGVFATPVVSADEPPFPGHPPIPEGSNPNEASPATLGRSSVTPAPDLAAGTIEVEARGPDGGPISGASVELAVLQRSPTVGERRVQLDAVTSSDGTARFSSLTADSDHWFVVTVRHGAAFHGSEPFRLDPAQGARVRIPVFPGTARREETATSALCFVLLSLRDDVIQVDLALRVTNRGDRTWLPTGYRLELPAGYHAFSSPDPATPVRFVQVPGGVELVGAVPPGEHEVALSFQLENPALRLLPWAQRDTATVELTAPPGVVRTSVWVDRIPGLRAAVDGFGEPRAARAADGTPGLLLEADSFNGGDASTRVPIRLEGLPRRGISPFLTVLGSLGLLLWGVAGLRGRTKIHRPAGSDVDRARVRLLEEVAALERARERGEIGPQTHGQARQALAEALARLEDPLPRPGRARRPLRPSEPA